MSQSLHVEVVSDHVCPWCYVGKKRLESAIAQRPELDISVTWLPFQLSPDMPREGRKRRDAMHIDGVRASIGAVLEALPIYDPDVTDRIE